MSLPIKCLEFVAILVVSADTGLLEGILPYVRAEWGKWPIFEGPRDRIGGNATLRWTSCSDVGGLLGLFRKGHSMQRTSRSG